MEHERKQREDDTAWDDLRVLLAVHRHQSFKGAGAALGLSTSTTARRIEALERTIGRPLVLRTSRGTALDPGALELVELAESMELGLRAARRGEDVQGGVVRVSTGDGFAGPLVQVLSGLRLRTPATRIELVAESRLADVARREADLAIRTARTTSALVIERRLGSLSFSLYASRAYVERRIRTAALTPADLARLDFVGFLGPHPELPQARWLDALGATRYVFRANLDAVVHEAVRQSQGVGLLADLVGDADPQLLRLDLPVRAPTIPVWLAFHRDLRNVPRVRGVARAIEAAFRARLA